MNDIILDSKGIGKAIFSTAKCKGSRKKCIDGKEVLIPCAALALKSFSYCRSHIKQFPEEYNLFLDAQKKIIAERRPLKYKFDKKTLPELYSEFYYSPDAQVMDMKNEVALLSASLQSLCARIHDVNAKDISNIVKIINQIRLLIKDIKDASVQKSNVSFHDVKLFMLNVGQVLKKHIRNDVTLHDVGKDVMQLYEDAGKASRQGEAESESRSGSESNDDILSLSLTQAFPVTGVPS